MIVIVMVLMKKIAQKKDIKKTEEQNLRSLGNKNAGESVFYSEYKKTKIRE